MVTMSTASAQRITEVINEKTDLKDPENPVMEVPDGSIVFDHVDFSYRKDSREPVLKDINLYSVRRDHRHHWWYRKCQVQPCQSDQPPLRRISRFGFGRRH